MPSRTDTNALLERLLQLIERLQRETAGFLDRPEQEQLWYNRGYANGMLTALHDLGYGDRSIGRAQQDPGDVLDGCEALGWGRAYRHGEEVGDRETREVLALRCVD
jgi:hypothetical protein